MNAGKRMLPCFYFSILERACSCILVVCRQSNNSNHLRVFNCRLHIYIE